MCTPDQNDLKLDTVVLKAPICISRDCTYLLVIIFYYYYNKRQHQYDADIAKAADNCSLSKNTNLNLIVNLTISATLPNFRHSCSEIFQRSIRVKILPKFCTDRQTGPHLVGLLTDDQWSRRLIVTCLRGRLFVFQH